MGYTWKFAARYLKDMKEALMQLPSPRMAR